MPSQPKEMQRKEPQMIIDLLNISLEAVNTEDEDVDPSFELNSSIKSDTAYRLVTFSKEWVCQLYRDNKYSLAMFTLLLLLGKVIQRHQNVWD